jgi:peroxiredoxin
MKKIIWVFLASLLLFSCERKEKGAFTIKMELQNAPMQEEAYLDELAIDGTKTIDTTKIQDASGNLTFKGVVPDEGLYRIRFADGKMLLLVLNGSAVTVKGDYNKIQDATITGSPSSVQLNDFVHTLSNEDKEINSLAMVYDSLKNAGNPDSVLLPQEQVLQDKEAAFHDYIIKFADTTVSPACAVFALSLLQTQQDLANAQPVFQSLAKRFPNNQLVKTMVDQYNQIMGGTSTTIDSGQVAPDISLPDPDGKILTLSNFRGKYVLVDFWASWCEPCRQENPYVVKAYNEFKNKNFTIFSVSLDSKKENWIKAIQKDGLTWNHVSDLKGWDSAPAATYGVNAIPANFLLNPEGKVIAENLMGDDLEKKLNEIFNK